MFISIHIGLYVYIVRSFISCSSNVPRLESPLQTTNPKAPLVALSPVLYQQGTAPLLTSRATHALLSVYVSLACRGHPGATVSLYMHKPLLLCKWHPGATVSLNSAQAYIAMEQCAPLLLTWLKPFIQSYLITVIVFHTVTQIPQSRAAAAKVDTILAYIEK